MADVCEQCGGPLSFGLGQRVRLPNGTETTVCTGCAQRIQSSGVGPTTPQQAPGFGAHAHADPAASFGQAPSPPMAAAPTARKSGSGVVGVAAILVLVMGAGVAFFAVRIAPPPVQDEPAAVEPAVVLAAPEKTPNEMAQLAADTWDGKSDFACEAGQEITLTGKRATSDRPVRADGDCQLTVIDCELTGNPAIDVGGTARVVVRGGKLGGTGHYAVHVGPKTRLEVVGTEITGGSTAVFMDEGARVMLTNVTIKGGPPPGDDLRALMSARSPAIAVRPDGVLGLDACNIHWMYQGIEARSNTSIAVRRSTILVDPLPSGLPAMMNDNAAALALEDGSTTIVVGGQLGGPKNAVRAAGNAMVKLEAVKLVGGVNRVGNATVEQLKESPDDNKDLSVLVATVNNVRDARAGELARLKFYEKQACAGVMECLKASEHEGAISATVSTVINDEGKAVSSTVKGNAPAKLRSCLSELSKNRVLADFQGPTGTMECRFSGTIFSGGQMLSFDSRYIPVTKK